MAKNRIADISFDTDLGKHVVKLDGRVVIKSNSMQYLKDRIDNQDSDRIVNAGITGYRVVGVPSVNEITQAISAIGEAATPVSINEKFDVSERFMFVETLVGMVIDGTHPSVCITGDSSLGKTFEVMRALKSRGLKSTFECAPPDESIIMEEMQANIQVRVEELVEELNEAWSELDMTTPSLDFETRGKKIATSFPKKNMIRLNVKLLMAVKKPDAPLELDYDTIDYIVAWELCHIANVQLNGRDAGEDEFDEILRTMSVKDNGGQPFDTTTLDFSKPELPGDYHIVKGFSSAKGLFRTLFENRSKIILFDDCDSILRDEVAQNILKAALESYDERWVSWNVDTRPADDIPRQFKFEGAIIFISNMRLDQLDAAVRARSMSVDLSMTVAQKLERMAAVLPHVLPDYDMAIKTAALKFIESKKDEVPPEHINFRTLINIAKIVKTSAKWEGLAEYLLLSDV